MPMDLSSYFESTLSDHFQESVRVDREVKGSEGEGVNRLRLLRDFHITEDARFFLKDLFDRISSEDTAQQGRKGYNHWLYGYYGSGKSHLLAIVGQLLDSDWIAEVGRDKVWETLASSETDPQLRNQWEACLDAYHVAPLLVNLLKEQRDAQRSFGRVLIRAIHQAQGYAKEPSVAFFEKWFEDQQDRKTLHEWAVDILEPVNLGEKKPAEIWEAVRRYPVLSEAVLPRLFEREKGIKDGLTDVIDRNLTPEKVAEELEAWRKSLSEKRGREARIILLLDEISLFIGTRSTLLTELNAFSEKVDEVSEGGILNVVTAQEDVSETRTDYAGYEVDFSIVADRFPHKYSLPSRHVGEIIRNRLLKKTTEGAEWYNEILENAKLHPADSFVYYEVRRNTSPPLDQITDSKALVDHLPLLPYHPALFLEILSGIRTNQTRRAKSIFSGTARALLAIVHALLQRWVEEALPQNDSKQPSRIISLVDFFDTIREELVNVLPKGQMSTISELEDRVEEGNAEELDVHICKVVLLLQHVQNTIPLNPKNIAVGIMDDLDGRSRDSYATKVRAALDTRLNAFIQPDEQDTSKLRFTTSQERIALKKVQERKQSLREESSSKDIISAFERSIGPGQSSLWQRVWEGHLKIPNQLPYREQRGELYSVKYTIKIDGYTFDREIGGTGQGLVVPVHIKGILGSSGNESIDELQCLISDENLDNLRRWTALSEQCYQGNAPKALQNQFKEETRKLQEKLKRAIQDSQVSYKGDSFPSLLDGIEGYVKKKYKEHFHPVMRQIRTTDLQELSNWKSGQTLPDWADKIDVTPETNAQQPPILAYVQRFFRRTLSKSRRPDYSADLLLKKAVEKEPLYEGCKSALAALLWGLCQQGVLGVFNEEKNRVSADMLLDEHEWHRIQVRDIGKGSGELRSQLKQVPTIDELDTVDQALTKAQHFIKQNIDEVTKQCAYLNADVETLLTEPVQDLLRGIASWMQRLNKDLVEVHDALDGNGDFYSKPRVYVDKAVEANQSLGYFKEKWEHWRAYMLCLDAYVALGSTHIREFSEPASSALQDIAHKAGKIAETYADAWEMDAMGKIIKDASLVNVRAELHSWVNDEHPSTDIFFKRLKESPWLKRRAAFDTRVGTQFNTSYLAPLRQYRDDVGASKAILDILVDEGATADAQARCLGRLSDLARYQRTEEELSKLQMKWNVVQQVTKGQPPSQIKAIGFWSNTDIQTLTDSLRDLTEISDPDLRDTEYGVHIYS